MFEVILHIAHHCLVSSRWPNVCGRESSDYFVKFRDESPFLAYCSTKHKAESLIHSASSTFGK